MIKATGQNADGSKVLVLGLSFGNLDRLRAGDPIEFDATPYGYDGNIMLFAMRDENVMATMLRTANPDVQEHVEKDAP